MPEMDDIASIGQDGARWYESAWAARLHLIRRWVDEGATSPHAVVKRLESHERRYRLRVDADGTATWHPQDTEGKGPLLPNGLPVYRPMTVRGHVLTVPYYTGTLNHNYIVDMLATESFDCIVELGCGYGRNLFEIFLGTAPTNMPYFGGELTESGRAAFALLATLEPKMDARPFRFDFRAPDFAILAPFERILFFTMHAIEQVHEIPVDLIERMAACGHRSVGVHFEPFGFQFEPELGPGTQEQKEYARTRQWNANFKDALAYARGRSAIGDPFVAPEIMGGEEPFNPTSLAIWRSAAR